MALGYHHYQKQVWKWRAVLVCLLACCVWVGWSVFVRWQVEREMAARRASVEAEYHALTERFETLQADVSYLKDERSLEAEIRKHFDVAKTGESVVILLEDPVVPPPPANTAASTTPKHPAWQFWR